MTARPDETARIDRGSFPVSASILDPGALANVIAADYEISAPRRCQLVSRGMNDALPHLFVTRQIWLMGLDCQNRGGWPIQWVNSRWLKEMVQPIHAWESEYPVLRG